MRNILVVDDEEQMLKLTETILTREGYSTFRAEDAESALVCLTQCSVDIIIADVNLPNMSGIELLKKIKEAAPESLVIMMTGQPTVDSAVEAVRADAYDYLYKPVSKDQLLRSVNGAVMVKTLIEDKKRLEKENECYKVKLEEMLKQQQRVLHKSQQFNDRIVKNSRDFICILNAESKLLFINPWGMDVLNVDDVSMILGNDWKELWGRCSRGEACLKLQQALEGDIASFQGLMQHDSYSTRIWDTVMTPILGEDQATEQVLVVSRDISRISGPSNE